MLQMLHGFLPEQVGAGSDREKDAKGEPKGDQRDDRRPFFVDYSFKHGN